MKFGLLGLARQIGLAALVASAALVSVVGLVGCGNDSSEVPGTRSMLQATTESATTREGANHAPQIEGIVLRPARPRTGRTVQATARVTDLDGDPTELTYVWQTRSGRPLGEGRVFDTTGLGSGSRLQVVVSASDGESTSAPSIHSFQLAESYSSIGLVVIDASKGTKPGATLRSVVELSDDDSGRIDAELEWVVNGEVVGTEDQLETEGFAPGDIVILRARLANRARQGRPISSPPITLSRGEAPRILSKPLSGIEGGLFRYQIRAASDEPDAQLTYGLMNGPDGMRVDAKSGIVEWRPKSDQRGRFEIEVCATDKWGTGVAQSFAIVADAPPASPR
jgi:hypothetical protein